MKRVDDALSSSCNHVSRNLKARARENYHSRALVQESMREQFAVEMERKLVSEERREDPLVVAFDAVVADDRVAATAADDADERA